jgi:hypothetical protein
VIPGRSPRPAVPASLLIAGRERASLACSPASVPINGRGSVASEKSAGRESTRGEAPHHADLRTSVPEVGGFAPEITRFVPEISGLGLKSAIKSPVRRKTMLQQRLIQSAHLSHDATKASRRCALAGRAGNSRPPLENRRKFPNLLPTRPATRLRTPALAIDPENTGRPGKRPRDGPSGEPAPNK